MKLRATAKWEGPLHGSLPELVGDGLFVITLDPKNGGQIYQGIVALEGETVAEILQNYMTRSEQLETRLWLAADEHAASGMLLQKLPEQAEDDADAWSRATHLASTLEGSELMQLSTQELLHRLWRCAVRCAAGRLSRLVPRQRSQMLRMLGRRRSRALSERPVIEVHEFCNHRYNSIRSMRRSCLRRMFRWRGAIRH
jgi:molecular chaperone Hsp33